MFACLPYLHLEQNTPIEVGSVRFIPGENGVTVEVEDEKKMVDALYLLYFAAVAPGLYHGEKVARFSPFTQLLRNDRHLPRDKCLIRELDVEFVQALGKLENDPRMLRAIRYFVHCFDPCFVHAHDQSTFFEEKLYEPENLLFLMTAFKTLLGVDNKADFKQHVRKILQIRFAAPLEVLGSWVDGFFLLEKSVVCLGELPDHTFKANHNFTMPFPVYGMKLFVYLLQILLVNKGYLQAPLDCIERAEVTSFLWTEEEILRKISKIIMQIEKQPNQDLLLELKSLSETYTHMVHCLEPPVTYTPTDKSALLTYIDAIISLGAEEVVVLGSTVPLKTCYPADFITTLKERVA